VSQFAMCLREGLIFAAPVVSFAVDSRVK